MNSTPTSQRPLDSFETALLTDLREVVAVRARAGVAGRTPAAIAGRGPGPRHRPVLRWAGVAAAAAVVATALQLLPGRGGAPAYAVTDEPDGAVVVTVTRLEDGSGLQEALRAKGINARVDYVPWGRMCDPSRLTPATPRPGQGGISVLGDQRGTTFTIPRGFLTANQTLVLESMVAADPANTIGLRATVAEGPVGSCRLIASDVPAAGDAAHVPPDAVTPPTGRGTSGSMSQSAR